MPGARMAAREFVGERRASEIARAIALAEALERDLVDRWSRRIAALADLPRGVR